MKGRLKRIITGSISAWMEGEASLTPYKNLYKYTEELMNHFADCSYCARQSYLYDFGKGVAIYFPDGRLFVSLPEKSRHRCKEDLYTVSCSFQNLILMQEVSVIGPKKNYIIHTVVKFGIKHRQEFANQDPHPVCHLGQS